MPQPQVRAGADSSAGQGHGVPSQSVPPLAGHVVITMNTKPTEQPLLQRYQQDISPSKSKEPTNWQHSQWQPQQLTLCETGAFLSGH
jgi:hypothetical protein